MTSPMTVAELIAELQKHPGDLPVVVADRWCYTGPIIRREPVDSYDDDDGESIDLPDALVL